MKLGDTVVISRLDHDDLLGQRQYTVGKGKVTLVTTSFVRVWGADGDTPFHEFFPIQSRRLWVKLAA